VESAASKPNLFGLDRAALREIVAGLGEPAYRAEQIYVWLYRHRARTIAEMTDLAKGFATLAAADPLARGGLARRVPGRHDQIPLPAR
jgi:23S rRNA (adenine2503-C2)-methyltransferase